MISGNFETSVEYSRKQMCKRVFVGSLVPAALGIRHRSGAIDPQTLPTSRIFELNGLVEGRKSTFIESLKDLIV